MPPSILLTKAFIVINKGVKKSKQQNKTNTHTKVTYKTANGWFNNTPYKTNCV